jgi:tRNA (adenine-N(1)-)-methyltransferase non-catalytic subunit
VSVAVARRPTAATVASAYFCSKPLRVGYLRFDALALMLGMANVGAHSRVLVMESCGGLVTAAVAERLGGHGVVCRTFAGPNAPSSMEIAKTFNFDGRVMESLRMVPLSRLLEQRQRQIDGKTAAAPAAAAAPPPSQEAGAAGVDSMEQDAAEVEVAVAIDGEAADAAQPAAADAAPDAAAAPQLQDGAPAPPAPPAPPAGLTHGPPYSGLILACPEVDAVSAMRRLLPLLAPSASFAVYSRSIQPLAECMAALRADGLAVNLTLQECWYREQQVLPGRTHPTMVMNHGGGCLLSGCATLQGTSLPTGVEGAGAAGGV